MQVDTSDPLQDIRDRYPDGLISQLLEIQKHRVTQAKWLEWARDPPCLSRLIENPSWKRRRGADRTRIPNTSKIFRRTYRSGADYVAVSYTSQPSEQESTAFGGYRIIGSAQSKLATPSRVRDCVLDRSTQYAEHHGIDLIWIDEECINRNRPDEHETAMQSMDLIYSYSKFPIGLLTKPLESQEFLYLLQRLLRSGFTEYPGGRNPPVLKRGISAREALKVVELLDYITSDKWWTRAWIFQEDYRSSTKMNLLIPHSLCLSRNQAKKEMCSIPGELQVDSATFHEQSTVYCLAFLREATGRWQDGRAKCKEVLKRAGKYSVLYQHGHSAELGTARKAMSPLIFRDIGSRKISVASDLLAIAANCCDYSVRLNTKSLGGTSCSLSITVLALYLLNGEIIINDKRNKRLASKNIFDYLRLLALDNFDPPVESKELMFIKHCRLVKVRLSQDGIVTKGRLWRLDKAIDTGAFTSKWPSEEGSPNGLNRYQRSRLRQFSAELQRRRYKRLANDFDDYLDEDAEDGSYPSKQYMDLMAEKIVEAIKNRETIHLGRLVGDYPYRAVFVTKSALERPSHVFTAWRWAGSGGKALHDIHAERLLDQIVSLEVKVTGQTLSGLPRLETKRWINGLCFFKGDPERSVVFNYPKSLTERRAASSPSTEMSLKRIGVH